MSRRWRCDAKEQYLSEVNAADARLRPDEAVLGYLKNYCQSAVQTNSAPRTHLDEIVASLRIPIWLEQSGVETQSPARWLGRRRAKLTREALETWGSEQRRDDGSIG